MSRSNTSTGISRTSNIGTGIEPATKRFESGNGAVVATVTTAVTGGRRGPACGAEYAYAPQRTSQRYPERHGGGQDHQGMVGSRAGGCELTLTMAAGELLPEAWSTPSRPSP